MPDAPARWLQLFTAAAAMLKPGGIVYIRDYGLYDMRHLSDSRSSRLLHARSTAYECALAQPPNPRPL